HDVAGAAPNATDPDVSSTSHWSARAPPARACAPLVPIHPKSSEINVLLLPCGCAPSADRTMSLSAGLPSTAEAEGHRTIRARLVRGVPKAATTAGACGRPATESNRQTRG